MVESTLDWATGRWHFNGGHVGLRVDVEAETGPSRWPIMMDLAHARQLRQWLNSLPLDDAQGGE